MPASRPSPIPNAWPRIEARHAGLRARLAEIDKATSKLVTAIEAGTDPAVINPRLADLRTEREAGTLQLASLDAPNRLSPEIDVLLAELEGLGPVLSEAMPLEKASIYHRLGLRLVYHPADKAVVATADLGRVLRRCGGGL
jgi:site-specific DNA recombinase